jgi:hypothetical protein
MKMRPVLEELFHAEGQTDRQTDMTDLTVAFSNFCENRLERNSTMGVRVVARWFHDIKKNAICQTLRNIPWLVRVTTGPSLNGPERDGNTATTPVTVINITILLSAPGNCCNTWQADVGGGGRQKGKEDRRHNWERNRITRQKEGSG